jgi:hypothetical protein
MQLALGIDTGGTYTDAVLVNHETGAVLAGAKALTTRHDLSIGIGGAIRAVFAVAETQGTPFASEDVTLVALSTTLATNALAEGHGGAVCLLLIGYDPGLIQKWGFQHDLATDDVVYLEGGKSHHWTRRPPARRSWPAARRWRRSLFQATSACAIRRTSSGCAAWSRN